MFGLAIAPWGAGRFSEGAGDGKRQNTRFSENRNDNDKLNMRFSSSRFHDFDFHRLASHESPDYFFSFKMGFSTSRFSVMRFSLR